MAQQITENMIREAAYFLWEKAGRPDGSAEYFWMKACEQFFKPKKVEIKKPVTKKVQPKKKVVPAKKTVTPVKKVATPTKKAVVKVVVKPIAKKVVAKKTQAKPVVKAPVRKPVVMPFYGSRR